MASTAPRIVVENMTMTHGEFVVQQNLSFSINRGDIFIVMGASGSGKTTLLRHLIGLQRPASGKVIYDKVSFWDANPDERKKIMRSFGVMYQSGALWSSLTLRENVALPIHLYTSMSSHRIREIASLKLALVGLAGFEQYYPAEVSGGMRKRAALARAMALDPDILFFDEPSAGLDPVTAHFLDDLILELRESLGATVVVVTHELQSIFEIGKDSIFLDTETKSIIASGNPKKLLDESDDPRVINFLTRGSMMKQECPRCVAREAHL